MKMEFPGRAFGVAGFSALACGIALCSACSARAQNASRGPLISPSMREAIRLKYNPPRGWIRHYPGEDRYKLGSVWRVVTTPNDKFYYPPFASEMLGRSPYDVIGFASAQDAVEAGYAPAPNYGGAFGLDVHQMVVEDARNNPAPAATQNVTTVNRSNRAQRITLADGVSSVSLPPNWKRVISTTSSPIPGATVWSDV